MKPLVSLRALLGWAVVVGMLVLSSPGVTIVHAESQEQALRAPGSGAGVVALETGGYGYGEEPAARLGDASAPSVVVPTD